MGILSVAFVSLRVYTGFALPGTPTPAETLVFNGFLRYYKGFGTLM